jgi:hypothetical protein
LLKPIEASGDVSHLAALGVWKVALGSCRLLLASKR